MNYEDPVGASRGFEFTTSLVRTQDDVYLVGRVSSGRTSDGET